MATESPARLLSYDDYAAIDDGKHYQVLDGELVMTPSPATRHQVISMQLSRLLATHVQATRQGTLFAAPYDVVLRAERPAVVLQPDLLFVATSRRSILTATHAQGAPNLVIEILSPSTARQDGIRKLALYARYGVPEVWFVPLHVDRVEVLRLAPHTQQYGKPTLFMAGEALTSLELPGLNLHIAELFPADEEIDG